MAGSRAIELTDRVVDLRTGHVRHGPTLTDRERRVLAHLVANPRRDIDREELLSEVWGYSHRSLSRTVDTTIRRLREKIEVEPARPRHLLTVWGVGYRFEPRSLRPAGPGAEAPAEAMGAPGSPRWTFGSCSIELDSGQITAGERTAWLTIRERAVLATLADANGAFVDTPTLTRAVWGRHSGNEQALHALIHRIRRKIEPDPSAPRYLLTVRSRGFRLVSEPAPRPPVVRTVVQLRPALDPALWDRDPVGAAEGLAALLGELDRSSRAQGGLPTGDGWCHLFADHAAALQWAEPLRRDSLAIGVHRGLVVTWTDPTGRIVCAGPAVAACSDLVARTLPGTLALTPEGSEGR